MIQSQETNQHGVVQEGVVAPSSTDVEELLERLQGVVVQFQRLIDCRSHASLQQPGHDGHWGVVEVLCYLRDWEAVTHERVSELIVAESPVFADPDTTMWPFDHDYGSQDSLDVFRDLAARRGSLIDMLQEADPSLWERTGIFEGRGEMTLFDFLHEVVAHDERYVQEAREAVG